MKKKKAQQRTVKTKTKHNIETKRVANKPRQEHETE